MRRCAAAGNNLLRQKFSKRALELSFDDKTLLGPRIVRLMPQHLAMSEKGCELTDLARQRSVYMKNRYVQSFMYKLDKVLTKASK